MNTARKEKPVIVVCSKDQHTCGDYVRKMMEPEMPVDLLSEEECMANPAVLSDHCHVIYLASASEEMDVLQLVRRMCG